MTIGAPAGPPSHPLLAAVRSLATALDAFDDAASRALGIGRSDLRALNLLEHGPVPSGVLATALQLTSGSVTALVDRLQAAGYVARQADPGDRRRVLVALTPKTRAAFAQVYAPCGRAVAEAGQALGPRQSSAAELALEAVASAVREQERALRSQAEPG